MARRRRPAHAANVPSGGKRVQGIVTDQDLKSCHNKFDWSLELADYHGSWGFTTEVFRRDWCHEILPKLQHFEQRKWAEIANETSGRRSGTRHHHVAIEDLIKNARKDLKQLELEDLDELYSLRLDGKKRLYGVVHGNRFKIVWYDTKHEVCPSKPR